VKDHKRISFEYVKGLASEELQQSGHIMLITFVPRGRRSIHRWLIPSGRRRGTRPSLDTVPNVALAAAGLP